MSRLDPSQLPAALRKRLNKSQLYLDFRRERSLRANTPAWDHLVADTSYPAADSGSGSPRVLVPTVTGGYLPGSQLEGLLTIALRLRGAEVNVLLCDGMMAACQMCTIDWYGDLAKFAANGPTKRHCRACFGPINDMYESLGVTVHRYSELVTDEEVADARRTAAELPLSELSDLVVEGVHVGEHAKAGALRFFGRGTLPDGRHPEAILRRFVEAALVTRVVTTRLLERFEYEAAVFHHGIYVPQGVVGDTARSRGVRVVNWNVAYRKSSYIFSHGDTYHHTLLSEPTSAWDAMAWSPRLDTNLDDYLKSRWSGSNDWITFHRDPQVEDQAIATETGVDFSKPCIGMLTNVIWDAQLHYQANAFPSMLDWARKTIAYFARRPELELLIRVHPAEITGVMPSREPFVEAIAATFPELPPNVHVIPPESRISTYAAMERCNAVLIFGTKTGVELAATGVPVVVAGEAWVRNKGITLDAESEEGYFELLDRLPLPGRLPPETVERARKYAYHFFFRRMIPLEFTTQLLGTHGFRWQVDSLADLEPGASRGLDVICDGILTGSPFVYPAEELAELEPATRS
jgi:hypothetical protein